MGAAPSKRSTQRNSTAKTWTMRPQMSLAPVTVDLDTQRIAVLLKELAPAAGLSVVVVHQFLKADP
jgi:hypothetical protein